MTFIELGEVDSTNNYAMRQIQAHLAEHGMVYFAWYQNAGKGQRGKPWKAEPGLNIMMSVVLEPGNIIIDNQFFLNIAVSLACFDLFQKYTAGDTSIKWPNDIYWRDRKAGGILIENVIHGKNWKYSIVGIGININQTLFPPYLQNPVSLKQITGKNFQVVELAKELCTLFEHRWQQLLKAEYNILLNEYISILFKINEKVNFKKDNAVFTATICGVNTRGELLIDTGEVSAVQSGSVEWIL